MKFLSSCFIRLFTGLGWGWFCLINFNLKAQKPDFNPTFFIADESDRPIFRHKPIKTRQEWELLKVEIRKEFERHILGSWPNLEGKPNFLAQPEGRREEKGLCFENWRLKAENGGFAEVELIFPAGAEKAPGKLPVFMTPWNHRTWALLAIQRGFAACIYSGADENDSSPSLQAYFPDTSSSLLLKRAWLASRVLDFLETQKWADPNRIALAGHSRNGKQALIAGAFDDRFDAVICSSAGTGGEVPWRFTHPFFQNESIAQITRKFPAWFHSNLKAFEEKEYLLPVDQHLLLGMMAPRPLLIATALQEAQACHTGTLETYRAVKSIFKWHAASKNFQIWFREGEHGTDAEAIETYLDWLMHAFNMSPQKPQFVHTQVNPSRPPYAKDQAGWADALGKAPLLVDNKRFLHAKHQAEKDHYQSYFMVEPQSSKNKKSLIQIGPYKELGAYLFGRIYLPVGLKEGEKIPFVLYLHGASFNTGFRKEADYLIKLCTDRGYGVLVYDQIGFGTRYLEGKNFYTRYPAWSKMGKLVEDAQQATGLINRFEQADSSRLVLIAQGLSATAAAWFPGSLRSKFAKSFLIDPFLSFIPSEKEFGPFLHTTTGLCRHPNLNTQDIQNGLENWPDLKIFQPTLYENRLLSKSEKIFMPANKGHLPDPGFFELDKN